MWSRISRFILRFRILLLCFLAVSTAFMAWRAMDVKLRYDFSQVVPPTNPRYIEYQQFKRLFGEDGNALILGVRSDKVFHLNFYNDWHDLGNAIRKAEGVTEVVSVSHVFNLYRDDSLRKLVVRPLPLAKPATQQELDSIRDVFLSLPFYENLIYNRETGASLMAVTIRKDVLDSKDRIQLVDRIRELAGAFSQKHGAVVHYSGLPFIRTVMAARIREELQFFVLMALLITAVVLFILFRSVYMVIFPVLVVAVAVVWSLGTIELLGYRITLLTGLIPPLLVVIGIPNCIYLLNRYHAEFKKHGNKVRALARVVEKVGLATLFTNLTTAIGFGVFYFTGSTILEEFGLVSFLNIMTTFGISLVFIPVVFSYIPAPNTRQTKYLDNRFMHRTIETIDWLIHRHRRKVYAATVLALVVAGAGILRMEATGFILDDIPHDASEYKDLKFFERHFGGVMPFEVVVDAGRKGRATRPAAMDAVNDIQEILAGHPEFSRPLSVVEGMKFITQAYYRGNPARYGIPNDMERSFILPYLTRLGDERNVLKGFLDSTRRISRVSVQMADIGSGRMSKLIPVLEKKIREALDTSFRVSFTGTSIVYLEGNSYLIHNLTSSLALALLLIGLCIAFLSRSVIMLFIALLPNLIPLIITAGIMGHFKIPIKPSTVLVFSIAFGIAVDTSIHFITKFQQEIHRHNWHITRTISLTLHETGRSMIYNSLTLFCGFIIFAASSFGGTVALGVLTSITLIVGMLTNTLVLPSLFLSFEKSMTRKAIKEPLFVVYDEEEDIEFEKLSAAGTETLPAGENSRI